MFQAIFTSHQEYTQLLFQTDLSQDVLSLLSRQPQFGQKNTLNEDEIHAIFDQLEEKIGLAVLPYSKRHSMLMVSQRMSFD